MKYVEAVSAESEKLSVCKAEKEDNVKVCLRGRVFFIASGCSWFRIESSGRLSVSVGGCIPLGSATFSTN
jgi:hypothetical protein